MAPQVIEAQKFQNAIAAFDAYNSKDPSKTEVGGKVFPNELLYAMRMTQRLEAYEPAAPEHVRLAVRCQHIGRWEIPRKSFPMDRRGYLQWRSRLALYHSDIASRILAECGYGNDMIEKVKFLLQKRQLAQHHPDTQLLEDVVCLVFIEHYLAAFAASHEGEKVIDILRKTVRKMSPRAIEEAGKISLPADVQVLVEEALR